MIHYLRALAVRLRGLFRGRTADREFDDEIEMHLRLLAERFVRQGMTEAEAASAARRQFGSITLLKEAGREMRGIRSIEVTFQDLRYGLRTMRKNPGFTCVAVLTLALGIGATTAIFTLIQQVMLQSLPVMRPDQLWRIGDAVRCCYSTGYTQSDDNAQNNWSFFSWEAYQFFRGNTPAFEELAAFQVGNAGLGVRRAGSSATIEARNGQFVSGNFFKMFGISAWRGHLFTDADDREGRPPVAVMSFHTWKEKYGSDPSVVGGTYQINGNLFTVIGVAQPGFFGAKVSAGDIPDFWLPLTAEPLIVGATTRLKISRVHWLNLIGRIRPDADPKTVESQLKIELHQWLASHTADMSQQEQALLEKQILHLTPGGAGIPLIRESYQDGLRFLLMAAVCVLLIACVNIANLLLARGLKDRPQMAIRAALGASRAQLVRKALAESLALSLFGAVAGIAVAYAGAKLILHLAFIGRNTWVPVEAAPSTPVLLFALGVSVVTGMAFGIGPAWMSAHADPIEALRGVTRSAGGNRHWVQKTLVIVQAAVSLVLLSVAVMLGQSLRNLEHQNFGFDPNGRYLVRINPMLMNYKYKQEQLPLFFHELEYRLRAISGIRAVNSALYAPMSNSYWHHDIRIEGKPEPALNDDLSSTWTRVTPGFFETLGARIIRGRSITDEDNARTRPVAVINEAFARRYFGDQNPVGRRFGPAPRKNSGTYEIIGVASDMQYFSSGVRNPVQPMYFLPEAQTVHFDETNLESREIWSHYLYNIVIWAPGNPPGLQMQVRKALADVDPDLVMNDVQLYSEVIHDGFAQQNMIASLTWLFGAVGLVLAAVGLYGVPAYEVEQRTGEIGIRMALGANRGNVVRMVLRGAFWQVGIGVALGIPAAMGVGRAIASQLFGVQPWNPAVLGGATLLLVLTALVAAAIPVRRAAAIDPIRALRME